MAIPELSPMRKSGHIHWGPRAGLAVPLLQPDSRQTQTASTNRLVIRTNFPLRGSVNANAFESNQEAFLEGVKESKLLQLQIQKLILQK